jgi:hypothetical protein
MADGPGNSNPFGASIGKEFNLDFRAQGQICNGEQAHSCVAEIDAEGVEVTRSAEYTDRGIQQLALATAAVWFGAEFEGHSLHE